MKVKIPQTMNELKNHMLATPKRRRIATYGGIVGIALLMSASLFATGPNADPAAPVERAWPVSVTKAQPQSLHPNFSAFGRLESNRVAQLRSDLIARVKDVLVKEGDWIEKGELLVKLDDREARLKVMEREAELKQQQANLASMQVQLELEQGNAAHFESRNQVAQDKLQRHQDLMNKRLISKALFDEVTAQANQASIEYRNHLQVLTNLPNQIAAHEASVARAQAMLAQAQLDLDKTQIRAPFAGPILAVHAAPGNHSNLSTPLVEVADAAGFEVRVQIPDAYTQQLQQLTNLGNITATAENGADLTLSRLANHVRTGQTGMDAFFTYDAGIQEAPALGKVFNLAIVLPAQAGLIAVPVQSIYENSRVYAVVDNRLIGHDIERVGELETEELGYRILIRTDAIQAGDDIITTQLPRAITGLLVDVANDVES